MTFQIDWNYLWFMGGCFFGMMLMLLVLYIGYQANKKRTGGQ